MDTQIAGLSESIAPDRSIALRPLRILEVIADAGTALPVLEVSRRIAVDRSTAYRILTNLVEAGYVERDATGTRYALSRKVLWLAKSLLEQDDSVVRIKEALTSLAAETGETVHYSVLESGTALLVHSAKGRQRLSVDVAIGDRSPLHATSAGKVLLAFSDPDHTRQAIANGLKRYAPHTITGATALRTELNKIRAQGFAYDLHELGDDLQCVAVPVFSQQGQLRGAISFSGPDSRFTLAKLETLRDAARPIASALAEMLST